MSHALCTPSPHAAKIRRKCTRQSRSCISLSQIFTEINFFSLRLSNTHFLIWLLTTPPNVKYVATLPCTLSLLACFADKNVSQGSVVTYARFGQISSMRLIANLLKNLPVKKFFNRLRFDRIMVMSMWPRFWPTLYIHGGFSASRCRTVL